MRETTRCASPSYAQLRAPVTLSLCGQPRTTHNCAQRLRGVYGIEPGDGDDGSGIEATRWEECAACRRFVPVVFADDPGKVLPDSCSAAALCSECGGPVTVQNDVPLDCWVQCELCGKARGPGAHRPANRSESTPRVTRKPVVLAVPLPPAVAGRLGWGDENDLRARRRGAVGLLDEVAWVNVQEHGRRLGRHPPPKSQGDAIATHQ